MEYIHKLGEPTHIRGYHNHRYPMHVQVHPSAWPERSIPETQTRLEKALLMNFEILVAPGLLRAISVENEADLGVLESLRMILSEALVLAIESRWSRQPEQLD